MAAEDLIDLKSSEGILLLEECKQDGIFQPHLSTVFAKQKTNTTCSVASTAALLNAHYLGNNPASEDRPFTEDILISLDSTSIVKPASDILERGMALSEIGQFVDGTDSSLASSIFYASSSSLEEFRQSAIKYLSCKESKSGIIVNFSYPEIGLPQYKGHFSPLAAYHVYSDRFLLLDTFLTWEFWIRADTLFNAMNTIDNDSGKTRGYVLLN